MSRTKTVFTSSELPHIWAHQSAEYGRTPGRGSMSFRGPAYYSYSACIARIVEHGDKKAFLINDNTYSPTTGQHHSAMRRAIPGSATVLHGYCSSWTTSFQPTPQEILEHNLKEAACCAKKASKARQRKGWWESEQAKFLQRAKDVVDFYEMEEVVDEGLIERLQERSRAAAAAAQIAEEKRIHKQMEEQRPYYEDWKNGLTNSGYFRPQWYPVAFRIEPICYPNADAQLVSTLGVRISLPDAMKAIWFVRRHRQNGWRRNGEQYHIGHYPLELVNENGVVAGCHRVSWEEIDRIEPLVRAAIEPLVRAALIIEQCEPATESDRIEQIG